MSYSYEYDESGLASSYLALSMVVPAAMYCTYVLVARKAVHRVRCSCAGCMGRMVDRMRGRKVLAAVLWMVVAYLVHNVRTLKIESRKGFDPLEVLGIEQNTEMREIKKRLRMLLMKYNVSKVRGDMRKEYEEKQKEINRAYGLVSSKEKYESWLNTGSKMGEIVAIPNVVVQNGAAAFLIYAVLLGVFLPRWAYRRWKAMREKNRVGVVFRTMEIFYEKMDAKMNGVRCAVEGTGNLMALMCRSVEFAGRAWRSNVDGLKVRIENSFACPLRDLGEDGRGYLVLMDHLFRMRQADADDASFVQRMSLVLIEGMRAIALAKKYGNVARHLVVLEAMVVQAVFDPKFFMLQIPFVGFEDLFVRREKMAPKEYLDAVLRGDELESARAVCRLVPQVEICEFSAAVINTGREEDSDDVQEADENDVIVKTSVDKTRRSEGAVYAVPERSVATIRVVLRKTRGEEGVVHAPYIQDELSVKWTVMLTIDDMICAKTQVLQDFAGEAVVKFTVDTEGLKKMSECRVFAGCGEYLDTSAEKSIVIKVE